MPEEYITHVLQLFEEYIAAFGGIILLILTALEFLSKKLKPWSFLLGIIGKAMNKDLYDKFDAVDGKMKDIETDVKGIDRKVDRLDEKIDEKTACDARSRILRFADEVYFGVKHSKEHFDDILDDITIYEQYCEAHPNFKNNRTVMATKRIKEVYKECLDKNSFL